MGHIFKKKDKIVKISTAQFSSKHQKIARLHSGNTIIAKALIKKLKK